MAYRMLKTNISQGKIGYAMQLILVFICYVFDEVFGHLKLLFDVFKYGEIDSVTKMERVFINSKHCGLVVRNQGFKCIAFAKKSEKIHHTIPEH